MSVLYKIDDIEKRRFYEVFQAFHCLESLFFLLNGNDFWTPDLSWYGGLFLQSNKIPHFPQQGIRTDLPVKSADKLRVCVPWEYQKVFAIFICFQPSRRRTVVAVRHFGLFYLIYRDKKKLPKPRSFGRFWRTERDSNPRYAINVYTSSSRAP